jgi:hypothetical protein
MTVKIFSNLSGGGNMPLTRLWARPQPCQAEAGIARRLDLASPSLIHDGAAVWKMAGTDLRAVRENGK